MSKKNQPIYIYAIGAYDEPITQEPLPVLKELVLKKTGVAIRRVGRFIQLALIGAADCVAGRFLPEDTAVYLSSERGDLETTITVMEGMYINNTPPKPLNFINTVSNAACFYVGRTFSLLGQNNFISAHGLAFEKALHCTWLDLNAGFSPAALVGSVDSCLAPLSVSRKRLNLDSHTDFMESSHWFLLAKELDDHTPLAELKKINYLQSLNALGDLSQGVYRPDITLGHNLTGSDATFIRNLYSEHKINNCTEGRGYSDSHSGFALRQFLLSESSTEMIFINSGHEGEYFFYHLKKL